MMNLPLQTAPNPKWVWNTALDAITPEGIEEQFRGFARQDGYGGVMIVPWGIEGYMTERYFELYGTALDTARRYGLHILLWDENGFPSGRGSGLFEARFPQHMAKRLDMHRQSVNGPLDRFSCPLPEGRLLAAVLMERGGRRLDVTAFAGQEGFQASIPPGCWELLFFTLVYDTPPADSLDPRRVMDYLSADAVDAFIGMTHQAYYDRFPEHFGTTIQYAFYDEPSFWHVTGGRIWSAEIDEIYRKTYGESPAVLYPALFMDIGEDTAWARNRLFGIRADLYADRYIGRLARWCRDHGIALTGHMDQEEIPSPVSLSGDLMKVFRHQDMPGVDEIFTYGRGSTAYKIVSSAACTAGKERVMCEVYGAMGEEIPVDWLYREAMDLYAKGITFLVPHGTWYDNLHNVVCPPELSYRSRKFGPALGGYNAYCQRVSTWLTGGQNAADVALLYPIADLQAGYCFSGDPYTGGVYPSYTNYMAIAEWLSLTIRRDFLYLHPEALLRQCRAENGALVLDTGNGCLTFRALILPAMTVMYAAALPLLRAFAEGGGCLIFAGRLPDQAAEPRRTEELRQGLARLLQNTHVRHLAAPSAQALGRELPPGDVQLPGIKVTGGNFSYIHKRREGMDVYFLANSSDTPVRGEVRLRGGGPVWRLDPRTGDSAPVDAVADGRFLRLSLSLNPVESVILYTGNL